MAEIPFAIVLGLSAVIAAMIAGGARKSVRNYIAFAAALYGALGIGDCVAAIAGMPALGTAVTFLVAALAPPVLALAVFADFGKPPRAFFAALVLSFCVIAGIAAVMNGYVLLAFAPLLAAVAVIDFVALQKRSLYAGLGAGALLAAAAGFIAESQTGFVLFSAAGLLGIALASDLGVADARQARALAAIRVRRPN